MIIEATCNALIKDFVLILKKENDFFSQSKKDKEQLIDNLFGKAYPKTISDYILSIEDLKSFQNDLKSVELKESNFLTHVYKLILNDFANIIDSQKNINIADGLGENSYVLSLFDQLLTNKSRQELEYSINIELKATAEAPTIIIKSPTELSTEVKQKIRKHFISKHKLAFPEFHVEKEILGGIKILENGELYDISWATKINKLESVNVSKIVV